MALTEIDSNTQTAVIDTEHTLKQVTSAGTYMLYVDLGNMVAGDRVELRAKVKILSGGSEIELIEDVVWGDDVTNGAQTPLYYTMPLPVTNSISFTLKQTDGTGRNYDWQVLGV